MGPRKRPGPRPGRSRPAAPKTWADAVTRFIDHHRTRRRSELTLRAYREDLDRFTAWHKAARGEEPTLAAIDAETLLDFMDELKGRMIEATDPTTGKKVKARRPKASTVNRRVSSLKSLIAWGVRNGYREAILDAPPNLAMPPRTIKSLDAARQRKLIREMERRNDHRARAIVLAMIHTGLRVQEFCSLTWSHVDLTRGKSAVTIQGKGNKTRVVELGRDGRAAFLDIRKRIEKDHGAGHVGPLDPVLVSARRDAAGGPQRLGTQGVQKMLARYS